MKKLPFLFLVLISLLAISALGETAPAPKNTASPEPVATASPLPSPTPEPPMTVQGIEVREDLEYLDLGKVKVEKYKTFAEELKQLPNLKKVDMFSSRPSEKQVWALIEAFPGIDFGFTMRIAGFYCRTDDVIFSMHRRGEPAYKSEEFKQLTLCPDMLALDLGHNKIKDLSFLKNCAKLKYLILADNQVSDLSVLAELKDLEYLEIFMNKVTDLSPLSELHQLLDLNLVLNQITDLSPLYGLDKLERVWLSRNGLPKEEIEALREALPKAVVNSTTKMATTGGWREHPRFFAMRHTFDKGIFIPFSSLTEDEK